MITTCAESWQTDRPTDQICLVSNSVIGDHRLSESSKCDGSGSSYRKCSAIASGWLRRFVRASNPRPCAASSVILTRYVDPAADRPTPAKSRQSRSGRCCQNRLGIRWRINRVRSASGKSYRIAMRGPGLFENYCSSPRLRRQQLGHLQAYRGHPLTALQTVRAQVRKESMR